MPSFFLFVVSGMTTIFLLCWCNSRKENSMALTSTQIQQFTDSIAKSCDDFNNAFILNTANNTPTYSTIVAGVGGTGTSQTLGRVLNWLDVTSEVTILSTMQAAANNVSAYIASIRSLSGYYQQFYPVLNTLDLAIAGGLNAFLTSSSLQISAYVASIFN